MDNFVRRLNEKAPNFWGKNIYVWGMGHTGELYIKGLERIDKFQIKGFCDKNKSRNKFGQWNVIKIDDVISDPNAFVLICSWQKKVLDELGVFLSAKNIPHMNLDEAIFKMYKESVVDNYNLLSDETSKSTYADMIMCRMNNTFPSEKIICDKHYFSIPQTKRYGKGVFINCGAYVGDTLEQFIWEVPVFQKAYAFEPDKRSFMAMKKRVERLRDEWGFGEDKICLFHAGVGRETTTGHLLANAEMSSMFVRDGGSETDIFALDDVVHDKVSLIIADIEGFEYDMIAGAMGIIKNSKPTMAVCIYHNAVDFFSIQQYLHSIVPEYRFSVRHCSVTFDETILFAYTDDANGWIL